MPIKFYRLPGGLSPVDIRPFAGQGTGFAKYSRDISPSTTQSRDAMEGRQPVKRILFVCSGNLCRSFMAERIFRTQMKKRDHRPVQADSAGLLDLGGAGAEPRAVAILREKGLDGSRHRSRALSAEMVEGADLVLVMEGAQRDEVLRRHPGGEGKVRLLKSFSPQDSGADPDIRDPYGQSPYHYRTCFAEIYFSLEGLLRCI
jgi:protein-tyrosine-phosphatase